MKISDDELFAALREMRERYPNWRFGQMIANLATWAQGAEKNQVWDIEDSALVNAARRHLERKADKT
jgi:hypothetical protein